jgi:Transposase IS116/IS110/IS902 family
VALTYRATVDVPARFRKSKSVGAVFGLTCSRDQSGERDRPGAISRCGDEMMRAMLYEAAQAMLLRSAKWSWLKAWAMQIARRRGMNSSQPHHAVKRKRRFPGSVRKAPNWRRFVHAFCLCNLPIELRGPFRGLCLCPEKLRFPTAETGVGRDSVRMLSQCDGKPSISRCLD